jgi:hypothetical protein
MARRRVGTSLKVLAVVGALWVVVAGVLVYVAGSAALASARARSDSIALLESVWTHASAARAALDAVPAFDLSSSNPDFAGSRQTADQYASELAGNLASVQADEVRLRGDRDRLASQATGAPVALFRSGLDHERRRAEGLLSALQSEDAALRIVRVQAKTLSAIFDAANDFSVVLVDHVEQRDVAGALALYPRLDAKLKTAAQLASGEPTPPQIQKLVAGMLTLSSDVDAFLQAARRGDLLVALVTVPKVQADATALRTFDSPGLQAYEQTLLRPYQVRFDSGARAAGFTPATTARA